MKIAVFDMGGTLMEYVGMPHTWNVFYPTGFRAIAETCAEGVSEADIAESVRILTGWNPRVNYREIEYPAERIFSDALAHWDIRRPIAECIEAFWGGLNLQAEVYPESMQVLQELKRRGYVVAALTDLPSAMPDRIFRRGISKLLDRLDLYMSSEIAGFRKPNPQGLRRIAERYGATMDEVVLIGDEEKDRQTAKKAGCRFIRICRAGASNGSVADLRELLPILNPGFFAE